MSAEFEAYHTPDADPDGPPNALRVKPLTPEDEAFCQLYAKTGNGTRSYLAAFDYVGENAAANASAKLRQPRIKARVEEIRERTRLRLANVVGLTAPKVAQMFFEMATADPNELIGLRIGCCRYCHGDGHLYQWKEHEYLTELERWEKLAPSIKAATPMPDVAGGLAFDQTAEPHPECPNCMGEGQERIVARDTTQLSDGGRLLFQGVKSTRNGLEVLMADRAKALEMAARVAGLLKDNAKVDVNLLARTVTTAALTPEEAQKGYMAMLEASGGG
jgi:phage terminase small subunit